MSVCDCVCFIPVWTNRRHQSDRKLIHGDLGQHWRDKRLRTWVAAVSWQSGEKMSLNGMKTLEDCFSESRVCVLCNLTYQHQWRILQKITLTVNLSFQTLNIRRQFELVSHVIQWPKLKCAVYWLYNLYFTWWKLRLKSCRSLWEHFFCRRHICFICIDRLTIFMVFLLSAPSLNSWICWFQIFSTIRWLYDLSSHYLWFSVKYVCHQTLSGAHECKICVLHLWALDSPAIVYCVITIQHIQTLV